MSFLAFKNRCILRLTEMERLIIDKINHAYCNPFFEGQLFNMPFDRINWSEIPEHNPLSNMTCINSFVSITHPFL